MPGKQKWRSYRNGGYVRPLMRNEGGGVSPYVHTVSDGFADAGAAQTKYEENAAKISGIYDRQMADAEARNYGPLSMEALRLAQQDYDYTGRNEGIANNTAAIQALHGALQQDFTGVGTNAAAIQALQNQPGFDPSGLQGNIDLNAQAIQALQDAPGPDLSGIAANQQAIQALQNAPQQDISGIANNAAAIQALQNAPGPDLSGIAANQQAITALQNAPQQDISGIGGNADAIAALQQQISNLPAPAPQQDISGIGSNADAIAALQTQYDQLAAKPTWQVYQPASGSGGQPPASLPVEQPQPQPQPDPVTGLNTPNVQTGIPQDGFARTAIDNYLTGATPYDYDFSALQQGAQATPSQKAYTDLNAVEPVEEVVETGGDDSPPPPVEDIPSIPADEAGNPAQFLGVDEFDAEGDDNFLTEEETAEQEQIIADEFDSIDTFDSNKTFEEQLTPEEYVEFQDSSLGESPAQTAADTIYNNNQQIYGDQTGNNITSLATGQVSGLDEAGVEELQEAPPEQTWEGGGEDSSPVENLINQQVDDYQSKVETGEVKPFDINDPSTWVDPDSGTTAKWQGVYDAARKEAFASGASLGAAKEAGQQAVKAEKDRVTQVGEKQKEVAAVQAKQAAAAKAAADAKAAQAAAAAKAAKTTADKAKAEKQKKAHEEAAALNKRRLEVWEAIQAGKIQQKDAGKVLNDKGAFDTSWSIDDYVDEEVVLAQEVKPTNTRSNNNDDDPVFADHQTSAQRKASNVGFGNETGGWTPEGFDFGQDDSSNQSTSSGGDWSWSESKFNPQNWNEGGPVMAYNMGGYISDEEKRKQMMASRIAKSQVPNTPLAPRQQMQVAGGGGGQSPLAQIGQKLAMKALLGPVSTLFGLNSGGMVGNGHSNPNGYNEGGSVTETPIKKVMDEQKLDQQAKAFDLEQKRKQETHEQAMRIKEQQAKQAAAMKKASATTSKTPKKPLAK